jgi:phage/plasmid-like protein (TIGR03299 family)
MKNVQSFISRQAAFHNLGKVKGSHATWAECLSDGGLDFDVFKSQLRDGLGRPIEAYGTFRWNREDKNRRDAAATIFLGTVGKDYQVINHASGFEIVDALIGSQDGAHYETAGVLGVGEVVWGLADLALTTRVGNDEQKNYLMFSTGHDGSASYRFGLVNTRVVCWNTFQAALSEALSRLFTVRHTANAKSRVEQAQQALQGLKDSVQGVEAKLNFLAGRKVTRESAMAIFDRLFPRTEKVDDGGRKVLESSTKRNNVLANILSIYDDNDGNAYPEQRGSMYNLFNAVTNYTDHARGNQDTRSESALFGSGARLKNTAMEVILEQANDAPALVQADFVGSGSLLDAVVANGVRR